MGTTLHGLQLQLMVKNKNQINTDNPTNYLSNKLLFFIIIFIYFYFFKTKMC